jgi:hypothetical protein
MMDLICLVADRQMEAVIDALLHRPEALNIRGISFEIIRHPQKDPGCYHHYADLLRGYRDFARYGLVLLDRAWQGAPADTGRDLERLLEEKLAGDFGPDWARAVVIDPELEVWVFADSPHVPAALGWSGKHPSLRDTLRTTGRWPESEPKPLDPKGAVEFALTSSHKPRSSSIYRAIASKVTLAKCPDRAFTRFKALLHDWFPPAIDPTCPCR